MSYSAEISRGNPTCFLFVIDQSGSMEDQIAGGESPVRKAQVVADATNKLLSELAIKCAKDEGVRDYFHVGVVGYGSRVGAAFGGALVGRDLVPISEVANNPARIEERMKRMTDGAGGVLEQPVKFPVWFDPIASGGTPMCQALKEAQRIVGDFLTQHIGCFPPIVVHITDGESTDGDPMADAEALKLLSSSDGSVLLFNLHVSSDRSQPITFPDSDAGLPDNYARQLFHMSSVLPGVTRQAAAAKGYAVTEQSRGFMFNAEAVEVVQFLTIGTQTTALR
jgi:hypothetical protein